MTQREQSRMPPPERSVAENALARLGANSAILLFGFATGVITARALGPEGKGALSALITLGEVVLFHIAALGFAEAAIIALGKGRTTLQGAVSAALGPLLLSSLLGASVLLLISIPAQWSGILAAVALEGLVLVVTVFRHFFLSMIEARERFVFTAGVIAAIAVLTTLGTVVFVVILGWGIFGAVLATAIASILGLVFAVRGLLGTGVRLRPQPSFPLLGLLLTYGLPVQASYLLLAMSQRFDQLLVYTLAGEAPGGYYSVALTIGQLAAYPAAALSIASFPRLAYADAEDVGAFAARICRMGLATSLIAALILAPLIPVAIPLIYGDAYRPATVPALVLTASALPWSAQWLLARAATSRGATHILLKSFSVNVGVMVVLVLLLVPPLGLLGAALASLAGASLGLAICVFEYRRTSSTDVDIWQLVPSAADFGDLRSFIGSLVPARRSRS